MGMKGEMVGRLLKGETVRAVRVRFRVRDELDGILVHPEDVDGWLRLPEGIRNQLIDQWVLKATLAKALLAVGEEDPCNMN